MMMGGGANSQGLLDLLVDPGRLRAHIDELHQANLARIQSADAHKRAKHEAEVTIAQLRAAESVHEAREKQIVKSQSEAEELKRQLAFEIASAKQKQDELLATRSTLETERADHQRNVQEFAARAQQAAELHKQKQLELEQKLADATKIHEQLNKREADAHQREQFIIAAANELTRPR